MLKKTVTFIRKRLFETYDIFLCLDLKLLLQHYCRSLWAILIFWIYIPEVYIPNIYPYHVRVLE